MKPYLQISIEQVSFQPYLLRWDLLLDCLNYSALLQQTGKSGIAYAGHTKWPIK